MVPDLAQGFVRPCMPGGLGQASQTLCPPTRGLYKNLESPDELYSTVPCPLREASKVSDLNDRVAGPSALDLAILRLDRAVVGLEQRMEGLIGRASTVSTDLFEEDRSQLAADLDAARARERELVAAGREASQALGQALADIEVALRTGQASPGHEGAD